MTESAAPSPAQLDAVQLGAGYFQDPLAYFSRMREEGPVTPVVLPHGDRAWMVTRYAEVRAALADPRLHKDWAGKLTSPDWVPDEVTGYLSVHMLNTDPPNHTRLRKLVTKAFTARRVAGLRPRVEAITASLLDAIEARVAELKDAGGEDAVDLIEAFAFPLPVTVICELLGVPAQDRAQFRQWSNAIVASEGEPGSFRAAGAAMYHYFTGLVAAKRAALAERSGSCRRRHGLGAHRGARLGRLPRRARADRDAVPAARGRPRDDHQPDRVGDAGPAHQPRRARQAAFRPVAAARRGRGAAAVHNPLNHATDRFTLEPVEIGGVTIPAREWVLCATSSANRDPDRFGDPDRLDVGRDAGGHVAFGHGIHYCLGAPLARLEGEVAFGALLGRFPGLSLAADPATLRWRPSSLIHGLEALPVRIG